MNPEDDKRNKILRFLYDRHKNTRGINKIPIGIRDLQSEMKKQYKMTQAEVSSNLDYLIQVAWVREVIKERSFTTKAGMELSQEQKKYKISDIGINHLEAGTVFKKPDYGGNINITNVHGVTVLGDGNIVNAEFTDLARALDELENVIENSQMINDERRLDAIGDVATIRTQIAKINPDRSVIKAAWNSLQAIATVDGVINAFQHVSAFLNNIK